MLELLTQQWLAAHGWDLTEVYDYCWLDCAVPGFRKVWDSPRGQLEICLCVWHAMALERGELYGDYFGALLPAESESPTWPWLPVGEIAPPMAVA